MKKMNMVIALALAALFTASVANADGFLRIKCFDDNEGADVFINGKEVGTCPVDAPAPAGMVTVRARKLVGNDYEKVFVKEVRVIDNVPLKMEISLSSTPQLTSEAIHNRRAKEAKQQLQSAESGDVDAMNKVARYYASGYGVDKNAEQAQEWRDKAIKAANQQEIAKTQSLLTAAQGGDLEAMKSLVDRYEQGLGTPRDPAVAQEWRDRIEVEITRAMLREAEKGDNPEAMEALAQRYEQGLGVAKDTVKVKIWREKAANRIHEIDVQERRARAQTLVETKEKELDDIDFFWFTREVWSSSVTGKERKSRDPFGYYREGGKEVLPITRTMAPTSIPYSILFDVALSPINATSYFQKKSELDDAKQHLQRISQWGNPDSLIARATTKSGREF